MNHTTYLGYLLPSVRKGQPGGTAGLDNSGKVPSNQLPSYVDDVVEYNGLNNFPLVGESGKIYVDTFENKVYRWSGSQYIEISSGIGTIDTTMSDTSTNAVANSTVKTYIDGLVGDVESLLAAI